MTDTTTTTTVRYVIQRLTEEGQWVDVSEAHGVDLGRALLWANRAYNPGQVFQVVERTTVATVTEIPVV